MERILHFFVQYPIDFIAHISSVLPIVIGISRYRYLNNSLKIILFFFIISFIKDTYSLALIFSIPNNLYVQNIESVYQTALIGAVFYFSFEENFSRRIIALSTILCTAFTLFYYKNNEVSSISLSTVRLLAIALALAYFSKIMVDMRVKNIMKHSMFWFSAGLLIYAAGTFFAMSLSEYWYKDINKVPVEIFDKYWNSSQILLIIFAMLSTVGLWFAKCDNDNFV